MAHVRGEASISIDAILEAIHHGVERGRQTAEIGVPSIHRQPGREIALRDRDSGLGYLGERSHGAAACDQADDGAAEDEETPEGGDGQ